MTRRRFFSAAPAAAAASIRGGGELIVPVHRVLDTQVVWEPRQIARLDALWSQAVRDLSWCGIRVRTTHGPGAVERPPYGSRWSRDSKAA